jgi:hypothetical protein
VIATLCADAPIDAVENDASVSQLEPFDECSMYACASAIFSADT